MENQTLTTAQIVIAVFSSSVLSAILTAFVNYRLTGINYKNEYYKKLLDNRLNAYQNVYQFLNLIKTLIHDEQNNTLTPYLLTNGIDQFEKVSIELIVPMKTSIWLSKDMTQTLTELSVLLNRLLNESRQHINPDEELRKIGYTYLQSFRDYRDRIEVLVKRDFKDLHNIKSFLL